VRLGGRGPGDGSLRNRPSGSRRFPGPTCRCTPADRGRAVGIEPASKLDSVRVLERLRSRRSRVRGAWGLRDWEYWKLPLVLQLSASVVNADGGPSAGSGRAIDGHQ
jgi:hypothetical protein